MSKIKGIALITGVLVMGLFMAYLAIAWTEPGDTPPGGQVPAPINVGPNLQYKSGALGVGGLEVDQDVHLAVLGGNVGIGTTAPSPSAKLEIAGQIKITGGIPGADKVLTSDAEGLASWQPSVGSGEAYWTFTDPNLYPNQADWNVGIGTTDPGTYKLRVAGTGQFTGQLDMNSQRITSVATPAAGTDAVNKDYVDAQSGAGGFCYTRWFTTGCPSGWTLDYNGYVAHIGQWSDFSGGVVVCSAIVLDGGFWAGAEGPVASTRYQRWATLNNHRCAVCCK